MSRGSYACLAIVAAFSTVPYLGNLDLHRLAAQPSVSSFVAITRPANADTTGFVTREQRIANRLRRLGISDPDPAPARPKNPADSADWEYHRQAAARIPGVKIVVSIYDRRLWLIHGQDTLLSAPAGVGMGLARRDNRKYDFSTPRGFRRVIGKETNPVWVPPDWHYTEMATNARPFPARGISLPNGSRVVRRGDRIGKLQGSTFEPLVPGDPITYDGILYIPPTGTVNRQVRDVLGKYKLDTGAGILIHGTNDPLAIGFPATHGCIRLADMPLEELFNKVKTGTPVYIY